MGRRAASFAIYCGLNDPAGVVGIAATATREAEAQESRTKK